MSRPSGSEERQHEREGHAQAQHAEEDSPSPPLPSLLEQNLGVPLNWLCSEVVEKVRLWL